VGLAEVVGVSMIKTILTCWMETDPAKDPFMDNVIRVACMACIAWIMYHAVVGVIERFG
jgi:hypothetical protein